MIREARIESPLSELVQHLLRILPADWIFEKERSLFIVIGEAAARGLQQYKVILEGSDWNPQHYPYALYTIADIRQGLGSGNLFYSSTFIAEFLMYDSGRSTLPAPLPQRVAEVRQQSRAEFAHGCHRAEVFAHTAECLSGEAPEVAVFLLHQAAELALRAFLIALNGREIKTHSIAELLLQGRRCAPVLGQFFTAAERPLLERLEKAYVCARYSLHYTVSSAEAQQLAQKIRRLHEELTQAFRSAMKKYSVL